MTLGPFFEDQNTHVRRTVFLGRALEKQGKLDEAASTYGDATKIKADDELGWKGLCAVYGAQGARGVAKHTEASLSLAQLYAEKYVYPTGLLNLAH